MPIPFLPVLKLVALGSIKVILLGLGALIMPVQTVRLVVGGTGESVRIAACWMRDHHKMSDEDTSDFLHLLGRVQQASYTRAQARGLLLAIIKKTLSGMTKAVRGFAGWLAGLFRGV